MTRPEPLTRRDSVELAKHIRRNAATARIAALEKAAKEQIESRSVEVQSDLLDHRLSSDAAAWYLSSMPTADDLMPKLGLDHVRKQLGIGG